MRVPLHLINAIRNLYQRLDAEVARLPVHCKACGHCCHFADFDHVLFLSSLEAIYLFSEATPSPPHPNEACPFLSGTQCTARERRALGCRTFFCDRTHRETLQALYEKYHRELKHMVEDTGIEWTYAPLTVQIEALFPKSTSSRDSA